MTMFVVIKKALFSDGGTIRSDVSQTRWYIGAMFREEVSVNVTPEIQIFKKCFIIILNNWLLDMSK